MIKAASGFILFLFIGSALCVPYSQFYYWYGGRVPYYDDYYSRISLPSGGFRYYGQTFYRIYVNTNGAISFSRSHTWYTPQAFPIGGGREIIAPYWADVDVRGGGSSGVIYYRTAYDSGTRNKANSDIRTAFPGSAGSFSANWVFVATWINVKHYYYRRAWRRNTFQCILATDGRYSFAIFYYADGRITWTTGDASGGRYGLGGNRAQVGFNKGDGRTHTTVPGSRTSSIVNIETTSNVGRNGVYIFRVNDAIEDSSEDTDPDQCLSSNGGCSQICRNLANGYECRCLTGYTLSSDRRTCNDNNECRSNNGGCQHTCQNTAGSFYCSCRTGYTLSSNLRTCNDINECSTGHPCPGNCINTIGSFQCTCGGDQTYDPVSNRCISPDYCASSPCQYRCVSGSTSYHCYCMSGYNLASNGRNCVDINECQSSNGGCNQNCMNTPGSYQCSCNSGYTLDADYSTCSRVQCPNPPAIDGFIFTCTAPHYVGDTCDVTCQQGDADLAGRDTVTCLITGYWEPAHAACAIPQPNVAPSGLSLSSNRVQENVPVGTVICSFIVTDRNIDQTHTFALTYNPNSFFRISNRNLIVNRPMSYEAATSRVIAIRVTDNGTPAMSRVFWRRIYIRNINEPPSTVRITNNVVAENAAINTVIGTVSATNPEWWQRLRYSLLTTGGGKFAISGNRLIVASGLNYEDTSRHMLSVRVTDNGRPNLSTITTITITVQDRNDAPTNISPLFLSIQENPAVGQTLTTFSVEDEDSSGTYSVTLTPSYGLVVNNLRLVVSDASMLDFEAYPNHHVTISTRVNNGGLLLTRQLTIQLADTNEAPTGISLSSTSVHEHSSIGSVIGDLIAADPDLNDTHIFVLLPGLQGSFVRIQNRSLLVNDDIDHETFSSFSIMVRVTDKGPLSFTQTLTISVINENEAPGDFSFTASSGYTCSPAEADTACVPENTPPPSTIGQLSAIDPDGDAITYTLIDYTGIVSSYFHISSNNLMLTNNTLNYESDVYGDRFTVSVQISDAFGHSSEYIVTVEILNVNDPPTTITLSNSVVSEDSPIGQIIGSLEGMDEDDGDQLTYRLGYSPSGLFGIEDNHLVVADDLNHESAINVHNISIICSDGIAETDPIWFVIEISDAAEPPINITLDSNTIAENSPLRTTIGIVIAYDMDVGEILTYQLDDDARGKFALVEIGGNQVLQSLVSFNYEEENAYNIIVRVTDTANHFKLQIFSIEIVDVDEPPENIVLHSHPIREGLTDAIVGVFTADDPERRPLTIQIVGESTIFRVDHIAHNDTFTLHLISALDYEKNEVQRITVNVTDSTTVPVLQQIEIMVLDQNEPPTAITIDNLVIEENTPRGTTISPIEISDPDWIENFSCLLLDSSDGMFVLDGLSLVVSGNLNYERQNLHSISLECADKGQLFITKVFNITVININDVPTDVDSVNGFDINENMPPNSQFAELITTDEDYRDSFTYILHNHTDKFSIVGSELAALVSLNFEEQSVYSVDIQSIDSAGASITVNHNIKVQDVNDVPSNIFFITAPVVAENSPINTTVAMLGVSDEDVGDTHTFAIAGSSDYFWLSEQGVVYTSSLLNYEDAATLTLDVVVTDNRNLNRIQTLTISVSDIDEAPHDILLSTYETAENQPASMAVAIVTVEDQDYNETFQCQLTQPSPYYFEIANDTGTDITLITSNSTINYEATETFTITLDCYDNGGLEYRKDIEISITDNNDPPTDIRFTDALYTIPGGQMETLLTIPTVEIRENANRGLEVTGITVIDEDVNQRHTCEIVNTTFPYSFTITPGPTVEVNRSISFEVIDSVFLEIRCTDGTESITAPLRVDIINVNEPLSGISLVPDVVTENSPSGTTVGVFEFVDPDSNGQSEYIFHLNSTSAPFVVAQYNTTHWYLAVSRREALDHEILPSFTLNILVLEINQEANFTYVQAIEVIVQDINESPSNLTFQGGYTSLALPNSTHPGIIVESFYTTDEDVGDSHTYAIVGGTGAQYFEISGEDLVLSEQLGPGRYDLLLDVVATDLGGLSVIRHFVITVTDISTCNSTSNPCHENAICFMYHPSEISCVCALGYSGDGYSCTDIDYCKSNPCNLNNTIGRCKDGAGGIDAYTCDCVAGYDPPNCDIETNECSPNPCDVTGSSNCTDLLDDFHCDCNAGYTGKLCEVDIYDCNHTRCLNNATCVDDVDGYFCECVPPYWGLHCENNVTVCGEENPCPNDGVCNEETSMCQCESPYVENCQGCLEGCFVNNITLQCEDHSECDNGACGDLVCVDNYRDIPCSFCCLTRDGQVDHCGPRDEVLGFATTAPQKDKNEVPVAAVSVPIALIVIIVALMLILGLVYARYRHVQGKNKRLKDERYSPFDNEGPEPVNPNAAGAQSYANPLYSDPFSGLGASNPMMMGSNRSSVVSSSTRSSYIGDDIVDPENKRHSVISNPMYDDD